MAAVARVLVIAPFLLGLAPASGAHYYMLPDGAGRKDGSSWEQAFDAAAGSALLASGTLAAGDRLCIGSGTYDRLEITLAAAGHPDRPVVIEGVDLGAGWPQLQSAWNERQPERGGVAIEIAPGTSHVTLRSLRLRNHVTGVLAPRAGGSPRRGLRLVDVDIERVRHGFYLSDCHDVQIEDCDLKRYTKHGFRLEAGCRNVQFRRCSADCSQGDAAWERLTELLPFGFFAHGARAPNTMLRFEDCLACNNLMPLQRNRYKNGDGFVVEEHSTEVAFLRCRALRNQDGGFDLKPPGVHLQDCVAIGNGRNFRLWSSGALENCFAGWGPTGLWCNGDPVLARRCTFFALAHAAVETGDDARGPVTLEACLVADAARTHHAAGPAKLRLTGGTHVDDSPHGQACRFVHPAPDWTGEGEALNSRAFPGLGWRFGRQGD